jgi:hypothetical protein
MQSPSTPSRLQLLRSRWRVIFSVGGLASGRDGVDREGVNRDGASPDGASRDGANRSSCEAKRRSQKDSKGGRRVEFADE